MDATATIEQSPLLEKEIKWKNVEKEVDNIKNESIHGLGIDPKIRRTVIALNVFGIDTIMSCEGHLDRGQGVPYVEISAHGTAQMRLDSDNAYVQQRHAEYERLKERSISINKKLLNKLQNYLDEFYKDRDVKQDCRLIAEMNSYGVIRLKNFGEQSEQEADSSERLANLTVFQGEMEKFGKFLEDKFFKD